MTATSTVLVVTGVAAGATRGAVERHAGRVGPGRSGETTASFSAAIDAVRAAIAVQQRAAAIDPVGTEGGPRVGIAVAEGDDERPSRALSTARALCARAAPGQILADELVALLLRGRDDVGLQRLGEVHATPVSEAMTAWEIAWTPLPRHGPVRVIVADDAGLVRAGLVRLLVEEGFEVLAEAVDADQLVAAVDADPPDLVVTDIRMPPTNTDDGLRAAALIRARHPGVAVLLLSQHIEVRAAGRLLDANAGGIGYLLKERVAAIDDFVATCRRVVDGEQVLDPLVTEQLMRLRHGGDPLEQLTERERAVLTLMAQGLSNTAIAAELRISAKTVETHVGSILAKLDLGENPDEHRRVAAVVRWLESRQ